MDFKYQNNSIILANTEKRWVIYVYGGGMINIVLSAQ